MYYKKYPIVYYTILSYTRYAMRDTLYTTYSLYVLYTRYYYILSYNISEFARISSGLVLCEVLSKAGCPGVDISTCDIPTEHDIRVSRVQYIV